MPRVRSPVTEGIVLDHVGIIVPDLDEAGALFEALGFTLTKRADHMRPGPDGTPEPAGSAQRSIMLERGYIELQEITDPLDRHLLSQAKAKHYGLHILAFGCSNIEVTHKAVAAAGMAVGQVLHWTRAINEPDLQGDATFAFFVADYTTPDEALYCWVEHRTPDLLRSPRLLRHSNSALGIDMVSIASQDETARRRIAERLVAAGGLPESPADREASTIFFDDSGRFELWPLAKNPIVELASEDLARPRCVMLELQVETTKLVREKARSLGLKLEEDERTLTIDLLNQLGLVLRFTVARHDRLVSH